MKRFSWRKFCTVVFIVIVGLLIGGCESRAIYDYQSIIVPAMGGSILIALDGGDGEIGNIQSMPHPSTKHILLVDFTIFGQIDDAVFEAKQIVLTGVNSGTVIRLPGGPRKLKRNQQAKTDEYFAVIVHEGLELPYDDYRITADLSLSGSKVSGTHALSALMKREYSETTFVPLLERLLSV